MEIGQQHLLGLICLGSSPLKLGKLKHENLVCRPPFCMLPLGSPLPPIGPQFRLTDSSSQLLIWLVSPVRASLASIFHPIWAMASARASFSLRRLANSSFRALTCLRREWLLTSKANIRSSLVVDRVGLSFGSDTKCYILVK